jgi:sulfotransferase family protein
MLTPAFDPDALVAEAEEGAGLADWGDPGFRPALDVLCASLEDEARLNAQGRERLRARLAGDLVQRLRVIDDHARIAGLSDVPITAPIIVTGNGRSGTTLIHKLLAECEGHRSVLSWEMRRPSPPPKAETWSIDARIAELEAEFQADGYKAPEAMAKHQFGADQADECSTLLELACVGGIYGAMARTPSYTAYRETLDFAAPYRFHRMVLQELLFAGPQGRMVLKAPEHMFHLPELLATYPDAIVIQMHRDPARVIPSLISVVAKMQGFYTDTVDVDTIRDLRMSYAGILNDLPDIRAGLDAPRRFIDVQFLDLMDDPVGTLARVHDEAGLDFSAGSRTAIERYMTANPRGKFGEHRYELSDYGLSLAAIDEAFGPYIDHCGVRLERR